MVVGPKWWRLVKRVRRRCGKLQVVTAWGGKRPKERKPFPAGGWIGKRNGQASGHTQRTIRGIAAGDKEPPRSSSGALSGISQSVS